MRIEGQLEWAIRDGNGRRIFEVKPRGGRGNIEVGVLDMLLVLEEKYNVDWQTLLSARREERRGRA